MQRKTKNRDSWKLVTEYGIQKYECGLLPGETITLKHDLFVKDHEGLVSEIIESGALWTVLSGSAETPGVVWLREPSGSRHTWDDTHKIFDVFERVVTE